MKKIDTLVVSEYGVQTGLLAAALFLPFHTTGCNISLLTAFFFSIIIFIKRREFMMTVAVLPVIMFVLLALSLSYSENIKTGIGSFELVSTYLFVPLTFGFAGYLVTDAFRKKLLVLFSASAILVGVIGYIRIAWQSGHIGPSTGSGEFTYDDPFSRLAFEQITNIHPSYLSIYLILAVMVLFTVFHARNIIKAVIIIPVFLLLLIMSAKNQIVLFFLVIAILIWNYTAVSAKLKILIVTVVVSGFIALGFLNDQLRYRFENEITKTLGDRVILWQTGARIIKEHPILGIGIGDTDDEMNALLQPNGHVHLINYNMHNQYLDYWLMLGVVGMLCFIAILIYPFRFRIDITFKLLIFIFGISMLSESMMYRQKGLVFFLLFYGLFGVDYKLRPEKRLE